MKNIAKITVFMLFAATGFYACQESDRITIGADDNTPPGAPTLTGKLPLNGGVRLYYQIPPDKDLLSVDAEYDVANGDVRRFSASYFVDSLDVLGMTGEQTVRLYAMDRAGNKSTIVPVPVTPLEPTVSQVRDFIDVVPGFSSVLVTWKNPQTELVNVYVTLNYTVQGVGRESHIVFTSKRATEQRFIKLANITTVDVSVYVGDMYGNASATFDKPQLALQQDVAIPKKDWKLPNANDTIGGVPMVSGDVGEGANRLIIDGIADYGGMSRNYLNTGGFGRTGINRDGSPWDFIIDLGDTYELSRIVTHQRHLGDNAHPELSRGNYYGDWNVGVYNMYVWTGAGDPSLSPWKGDETGWEFIGRHSIPIPAGTAAELSRQGYEGDEAIMYPDDPHYTRPTRWFRYEAIASFGGGNTHDCLSEITLYGKKK